MHRGSVSGTQAKRRTTGSDFGSLEYWQARFTKEEGFEWLEQGTDILLDLVVNFLSEAASQPTSCQHGRENGDLQLRQCHCGSRTLHLGSGSSHLSNRLRDLYERLGLSPSNVLNVDFAPSAIESGMKKEQETFKTLDTSQENMAWAVTDVLDPEQLQNECGRFGGGFDLVVEKSCLDAICCAEPRVVDLQTCQDWLAIVHDKDEAGSNGLTFDPCHLAALSLAQVVKSGGRWLALTYSSTRFDFLRPGSHIDSSDSSLPHPSTAWSIESKIAVPISGEVTASGVSAPDIEFWIWILKRIGDGAS